MSSVDNSTFKGVQNVHTLWARLPKHWQSLVVMLSIPLLALIVTILLRQFIPSLTLFIFLAAVAFCAYFSGFVAAILSAIWSIILVETVLFAPETMSSQMSLWYLLFLGVVVVIVWLQEQLRKTNERLGIRTEQLNAILNAVNDGITVQDRDGNYTFANAAAARLTGLSEEQIRRIKDHEIASIYQMASEDGRPLTRKDMPFQKAVSEGVRAEIILCSQSPYFQGERWFHITAVPIINANGEPQFAVNVFRDITERKTTEAEQKALQEKIAAQAALIDQERQRFEDLLHAVPVMVWEGEGNPEQGQVMTYINSYGEQLLGYTLDEWNKEPGIGLQWIHPEDLELAKQKSVENFKSRDPQPFEFRFIARSGRIVTIEARATIVRDAQGQAIGARGIMVDISERRRIEEELRRSNEELQQFAYVASHDLQEPLRMITSYLQLLNDRYADRLDDEAREFIDFAVDGAVRMKALISDLLTHSRVQTNQELFAAVDMNAVVQRAQQDLANKIKETGAVIEIAPLPTVTGNFSMLAQLMQNLLSNALKFRSEDTPKITIGVERKLNNWVFTVRDNGIGIDLKHAKRIFIIFQRLHSRSKYTGTGIGLAICKKVVERHNGSIWVESGKGEGATFYFTLPVAMK
jgi:PAS domain S-box-containing protein